MARGAGRKPFPTGEALSRMLSCRVRPGEEKAIRAAAAAEGKRLAEWIREALLRSAKAALRAAKGRRQKAGTRDDKRRASGRAEGA